MSDRDHRTLAGIVRKDHKNTALKITAELNEHLMNPVSSKTEKGGARDVMVIVVGNGHGDKSSNPGRD